MPTKGNICGRILLVMENLCIFATDRDITLNYTDNMETLFSIITWPIRFVWSAFKWALWFVLVEIFYNLLLGWLFGRK